MGCIYAFQHRLQGGVGLLVGLIAPFTDVTPHPGGNCAVRDKAIQVVSSS